MAIYIALLRGINVSGQKLIKMEELRSIFTSMQFDKVRTYIQSGNIIFEAPEQDPHMFTNKIESELNRVLGYEVPVILRTVDELEEIIRSNPFAGPDTAENGKLYLTLLSNKPTAEAVEKFESYKNDIDDYHVMEREVFILCRDPRGYGKSQFSNNFVEKKLGVSATTRNWETINKIVSMARS